jgi:hypothetical protein
VPDNQRASGMAIRSGANVWSMSVGCCADGLLFGVRCLGGRRRARRCLGASTRRRPLALGSQWEVYQDWPTIGIRSARYLYAHLLHMLFMNPCSHILPRGVAGCSSSAAVFNPSSLGTTDNGACFCFLGARGLLELLGAAAAISSRPGPAPLTSFKYARISSDSVVCSLFANSRARSSSSGESLTWNTVVFVMS